MAQKRKGDAVAKAKKKAIVKKRQVAKKKKAATPTVLMMTAMAVDKEARARALTLQALRFTHVTDATKLADLGFDDAPSKAALAQALRALGVNINDAPVIACSTVGQVIQAVKARI